MTWPKHLNGLARSFVRHCIRVPGYLGTVFLFFEQGHWANVTSFIIDHYQVAKLRNKISCSFLIFDGHLILKIPLKFTKSLKEISRKPGPDNSVFQVSPIIGPSLGRQSYQDHAPGNFIPPPHTRPINAPHLSTTGGHIRGAAALPSHFGMGPSTLLASSSRNTLLGKVWMLGLSTARSLACFLIPCAARVGRKPPTHSSIVFWWRHVHTRLQPGKLEIVKSP